MKRIGLISDTHGYLDERVFHYFHACDEIWHAGDIGPVTIAQTIQERSGLPFRAVYGNIDGQDVRAVHPLVQQFTCEAVKVLMIHIGGHPKRYAPGVKALIAAHQPGLFISGHSHILKIMFDEQYNCLHINPGAAGKQGWHKVRTLVRFTIDESNIRDCEVIELGLR